MKQVWMDQGGTFTDVVRVTPDGVQVQKVLTDQVDLAALGRDADDVRRGTTVATNALLERDGAPTLLITTAGFGDLAVIGDQTRPSLFSLKIERPPPLHAAVLEVSGRISAQGSVLSPVVLDKEALAVFLQQGIVSVAVVLVHGPLCPEEEVRVGALCREVGFSYVALGHEVAPSRGFLDRLRTTLVDAATSPLLPRAPGLYMRSDGGLATEDGHGRGTWRGRDAVLSGPAGGVIACAALCAQAGITQAFGLDMGGTSTDVCRVAGAPERVEAVQIAGWRVRTPAIRLETVAAGGGSRLFVRGGVFAVGPESAGASPGPAAYGRGGPATVTDCEAVLGRLPAFPEICGPGRDAPLDIDAARRALQALSPRQAPEAAAVGFKAVAAERMAGAISRLAARLGVDPAAHALVAFGGAGPGHACAVAARLKIDTVLVPHFAGTFSAVGIGVARRRAERIAPVQGGDVEAAIQAAIQAAKAALPFEGTVALRLAMRHTGTAELIEIALPEADIEAAFHAAHRRRFGFVRPQAPIEPVEVRIAVESGGGASIAMLRPPAAIPTPEQTVQAWFDGEWRAVPLQPATAVDGLVGPAVLLGAGTTIIVEPGWVATATPHFVRLTWSKATTATLGKAFDPVHTAVFGARVMAIAERMGERLARLARSVSIRQRRDFSCAVFDADGQLVANAPHVPVHLGAMGETVRDLISRHGDTLAPGQAWASNDPYAGGSHLPDITVTQPVFFEGALVGFVACRGHHIDVGGIQPGSMPPHATHIDEEGFILRQVPLIADGRFVPPRLPGCRQPEDVIADLEAQVAACAEGAHLMVSLAEAVSLAAVHAQMRNLRAWASRVARDVLHRLEGIHRATEILDDGTPIKVTLQISRGQGQLRVDAPAHPGNLNAPRAVATAALLYVLRCLIDAPIPLNEGSLSPFALIVSRDGLFDPRPPAAVAGGNVETSQRLVDALLRALGALAASQGTMNNLTVGTPEGAFYETLGGGSGAGPTFDGASAVQVHMTNTRATDVEELEARFPVRLAQWSVRSGSGGSGTHRGGDGMVKVWVFLAPAEVALMAGRRDRGASGLRGGQSGAPGVDERDLGAGWEPAPARWTAKPGDRFRIATPGGGGFGEP